MGIISDNLTRYVADHPELAPTPIDMFHNDEVSFVEMCDMLAEQEASVASKSHVVLDPSGWGDPVADTHAVGARLVTPNGIVVTVVAIEADRVTLIRDGSDATTSRTREGFNRSVASGQLKIEAAPVASTVEIEWLDRTIESLEAELAEYSNFAWNSPGRVFRHETLIRLVARRDQIAA